MMTIDLDKESIVAIDKLLEETGSNVPLSYRSLLKLAWIRAFHSGWEYAAKRWSKMIDETLPTEEDIKKELGKIREQTMEQPR